MLAVNLKCNKLIFKDNPQLITLKNIEDNILKDIEIEKENAWLQTNVSGMDFREHIFFALFGDDGKPLIEVDQTVRKNKKKTLRKPGI